MPARTPTEAFLRSFTYLAGLQPAELATLAAEFTPRDYERGDLIMLADEPCRGLYLVESGRVRIFKTSPDGREQVLSIAGPGDSFNEVPNFDGGPNPASAAALETTRLFLLRRAALLHTVERYPRVAIGMLRIFAGRLRHLTNVVEDLSFRNVTSRLAKVLLEHADASVAQGEAGLRQRLTQQEMAAMIGTAREMVGRSLKALEAQGAVRMERHRIIVTDRKMLERLI
ncbi:MAG: Crp/Fnr family transcriptional regulator [Chloroflexota bacterium]